MEAERLGVTLCLPGRSPPRAIAAALLAQVQGGQAPPEGLVHRGVERSGEALRSVFERARAEGRYDAAALEASIAANQGERDRVREENERRRSRISHLRASVAARRQALTAARTATTLFPITYRPFRQSIPNDGIHRNMSDFQRERYRAHHPPEGKNGRASSSGQHEFAQILPS